MNSKFKLMLGRNSGATDCLMTKAVFNDPESVSIVYTVTNMHTYIHPFNGPLSGTTRVSRYQKGKTIWILQKQEAVSGSGISWAVCKSAPHSRQITTPAPHHLVFLQAGCPPAAQPTASKH